MKTKILGILVVTLLIATALPSVGTMDVGKDQVVKCNVAGTSSDWYIEVVDSEGDVGLYPSSDGFISYRDIPRNTGYEDWYAYYDKTNGDLKCAIWDGETWNIETVDSEGDVGLYASCYCGWDDENDGGLGTFQYYDKTNGDLKCAIWDGETWNIETVDSEGDVGQYCDIDVDWDGDYDGYTSYYDKTNDKLKYATLDDGDWDITVVGNGGQYCSMALTSDGRPYIAYVGEDGGLEFSWICGLYGEWYSKVVDSSEKIYGVSIAVDSSDNPYIGYYTYVGDGDVNVNVANGNSYTWTFTIETVDEVEAVGDPSVSFLSLDYWDDENDGGLGICYYDEMSGDLKYATKTIPDGEWEIQVVDSEGDVGQYSSLCIVDGRAIIVYYDATNGDLKRAVEEFQEVWVDDDANTGWYNDRTHVQTIQKGLNIVSTNGTIYVCPGIYNENVIWPDKLGIQLCSIEGLGTTVIDGGENGDVIYASDVDKVLICGFTIQNGGRHGIFFDGCKNCCIYSCHICSNEVHGIYLNECDDCDTGSCCPEPADNPCGNDCPGPTEIDENGEDGIHQDDSDGCDVGPCCPGGCCPGPDEGDACAPPEVHDNGGDGIHLERICDCHVIADVYQNGKYGYILVVSDWGKIISTDFYEYPKEEKEECRNVYDNGDGGIRLEDSHNCIIGGINIYGHDEGYGVYIDASSSNNLMFHNNFTNNMQNAFDEGLNAWDNGFLRGGNHWDDYTGTDSDGNGIGDISYPIPGGNNEDDYPLMESWSRNGGNQPPTNPTITGPINGKAGTAYDYIFSATEIDGDKIYYYIEWGDEQVEEWIGPYYPGTEVTISHTWSNQSIYTIRVKAKDPFDVESDWAILEVSMPKNKVINTPFLNFLENYPHMFPILRQLLGLQ